jgi:hypothetical protein
LSHRYMLQQYNTTGDYTKTIQDVDSPFEVREQAREESKNNFVVFVYFYNAGTPYHAQFVAAYINGKEVFNQSKK